MAKFSNEEIIKMNELYLELKTFSAVSRAMGGSPSPTTVKKYIIQNYVSKDNIKKQIFSKEDIPKFQIENFKDFNYRDSCLLSDEEKEEIKELWKELLI